jgi:hypothetical protein
VIGDTHVRVKRVQFRLRRRNVMRLPDSGRRIMLYLPLPRRARETIARDCNLASVICLADRNEGPFTAGRSGVRKPRSVARMRRTRPVFEGGFTIAVTWGGGQ